MTHGQLANELVSAAEMIVGEINHITAVSIGWHDDVEIAREEVARAVARLDSGEDREAATEPALLAPIVEKAMQRLEDEARRSRVTMVLEPRSSVSVTASPAVVSVAVSNVLHNAVKFCGTGGRVSVNVDVDGRDAVVEVSDTGPGVMPEEMPLIFERFHRGSGPRAAGAPGVGLGLAICRALVERQGGRISVASTPGRGATFAIRLPVARTVGEATGTTVR